MLRTDFECSITENLHRSHPYYCSVLIMMRLFHVDHFIRDHPLRLIHSQQHTYVHRRLESNFLALLVWNSSIQCMGNLDNWDTVATNVAHLNFLVANTLIWCISLDVGLSSGWSQQTFQRVEMSFDYYVSTKKFTKHSNIFVRFWKIFPHDTW